MPKHDDTQGAGRNRCATTESRLGKVLFCWDTSGKALGVMTWGHAFRSGVFGNGRFEVPERR